MILRELDDVASGSEQRAFDNISVLGKADTGGKTMIELYPLE